MARKPDGRPARQAGDGALPDYAVGYGKPPRHSRFQPGRSGNPRGKPKGCVNLRALLEKELQQPTIVMEGGRRQRLNKAELLIKTTLNRAIKGDAQALRLLFQLGADTTSGKVTSVLEQIGGSDPNGSTSARSVTFACWPAGSATCAGP